MNDSFFVIEIMGIHLIGGIVIHNDILFLGNKMVIRYEGTCVIIVPRFSSNVILVSQCNKNFLSQRECHGHADCS